MLNTFRGLTLLVMVSLAPVTLYAEDSMDESTDMAMNCEQKGIAEGITDSEDLSSYINECMTAELEGKNTETSFMEDVPVSEPEGEM